MPVGARKRPAPRSTIWPSMVGPGCTVGAAVKLTSTGMRSFTYTCNVDVKSSEAVAVMLRDTTPQATAKGPPPKPPAEPDLSELSPAACESSAVAALKARWTRAVSYTHLRAHETPEHL